ncbi:MAG: methyltransferase [Bacteroidota bacterium]
MKSTNTLSRERLEQQDKMQSYYEFQSKIYDLTRWAFLFGRSEILHHISFTPQSNFQLMEIGCGTGANLTTLAKKFPQSELTGVDVSKEMIGIAQKKLDKTNVKCHFFNEPYGPHAHFIAPPQDIILCSYSLSMINPQWPDLIDKAYTDLKIGGKIMVVDFFNSQFSFFKNHMSNHHVKMDGHILPKLKKVFKTDASFVKSAYGGLWEYFMFVGSK